MSDNNNHKNFPVGKKNLVLMAISFVIIIVGFVLMLGPNSDQAFNPDIFSFRRITVGPMVSLFGFVFMIFAIMYKFKDKNND
ncbi:MAG: DUF3098 domain-containing protein [Paludibacteraceae bacterium]|jgi:uncharacterized membrane protein|nr:DUF3098 domain-containing protein [Bacteroidales bacterium]MBP3467762.1 DUF3098 domain-containing protein [Paludibacteraceae bacterium]MBQ1836624.1 DUF3098 domain-containing protein [Paludibacteraceae bacterium]MBQ2051002.1 DUF3098 domain-containing protein [Paludibacteraceae bacterium]MBQ2590881.1 DUF3098 domain-containing protein [Paludibacteraceae bacterium]